MKLWDELGAMRRNHGSSCVCAAQPEIQKVEEEDKVYQFLMGLNEMYVGVRSNLLMLTPLPALDDVYNILFQDENQRQVHFTPQLNPESAYFHVNITTKPGSPAFNSNMPPPARPPTPPTPPRKHNQMVNFNQSKTQLVYRSCKKVGHSIDNYYKIREYPAHYKFNKGRELILVHLLSLSLHSLKLLVRVLAHLFLICLRISFLSCYPYFSRHRLVQLPPLSLSLL
ncbi:hypothetical protein K7X08_017294 [Anisodus acutangulus]|uniref:Uncharacterized protein n=1 Tax=Anisodus acutangulus TaxID=402998 RepID=A0A9Q1R9G0_9SOLA|nr:hypothetical protein K7X08_017294 [Anisodus acutangulus]